MSLTPQRPFCTFELGYGRQRYLPPWSSGISSSSNSAGQSLISSILWQFSSGSANTVPKQSCARAGCIHANNTYPAEFLLENLKIQSNVIETAYSGLGAPATFSAVAVSTRNLQNSRSRRSLYSPVRLSRPMSGMPLPRSRYQALRSTSRQHGFDAISLMPTNPMVLR